MFLGPTVTGLRVAVPEDFSLASLAVIAAAWIILTAGLRSWWTDKPQRPWLLAAGFFTGGCLAVQSLWPYMDTRYYLPLLPLGLALLVEGGCVLSRRSARPRRWAILGLAVPALAYAAQDARLLASAWFSRPAAEAYPSRTMQWITRNIPEEGLLLGRAPLLYLYTGRQGLLGVLANDSEEFRFRCLRQGLGHVVEMPVSLLTTHGGVATDQSSAWIRNMGWAGSWPEAFAPLYEDPQEQTKVYQVVPDTAFIASYSDFLRARDFLSRGDQRAAGEALDQALRLRPGLVCALNAKAVIRMLAGQLKEADGLLRRALNIRPDHALALANMARLEAKQGRKQEALRLYARALAAIERTGEFESLRPVLRSEAATLD